MRIDEIEKKSAPLSYQCLKMQIKDIQAIFNALNEKDNIFNPEIGSNGFHDCKCDKGIIRGFYTVFKTFEVEHYILGLTTKENFVRLEHCEFIITPEHVYVFGKPTPARLLVTALTAATGTYIERVEFDLEHIRQENRFTVMKTILLENSKHNPIRRARLTGCMREYKILPTIEVGNHEINSIKGIIETPLGPIDLTVNKKGKITLDCKNGLILSIDNLNFIFDLITKD